MEKETRQVTLQETCDVILSEKSEGQRLLVAMAGAPGSGKSMCAEKVQQSLNKHDHINAAILPMDGYHYDDLILNERGLRPLKGAPETFDVGGFRHMLHRLRCDEEAEVYVPVFDRDLEISRAGARVIDRETNVILVEGNYVLLGIDPWISLAPLFDIKIMIFTDEDELRRRLTNRWISHGIPENEIPNKVEQNDLPNGRFVYSSSIPADFVINN
ncbi:nucleoside/nucleotide kinase family protein [Cohaesibacter celericrescens]|uniref:Nucleoside/nucleotide kinase family protein n=1 Tax=Cohaesibacter celericrescens TaxID=2067669 RepID=A0A2N5XQ53_9HYPH|nr:nucleoside/nucleotide kinase family protein [Cohaesibacter celericrescens]PLW76560.1 nucleoside/nucleotide kinase family protein [Cohaesibacter celericrescens]